MSRKSSKKRWRKKSKRSRAKTQDSKNVAKTQDALCSPSGAGGKGDRGRNHHPDTNYFKSQPFALNPDVFFYLLWRQYWEARKIVDIPPADMTREGWTWESKNSDPEVIKRIEKSEKKVKLLPAVFKALRYERLYGAGAILIGTSETNKDKEQASMPLNISDLSVGDLRFLRPLPRRMFVPTEYDTDPLSPNYQNPETYTINGHEVHRSRLLIFDGGGDDPPVTSMPGIWTDSYRDGFGTSVLEPMFDDIIRSVGSRQAAFQLVQIASIMLLKKGKGGLLKGTKAGKNNLDTLQEIMDQISIYNSAILDKDDDVTSISNSFQSVPQVMLQFLQTLSAGSDIPAPRFLGQAPGGLNATGKGDLVNYYDMIKSRQTIHLQPQLEKIAPILTKSATGRFILDLEIKFNPLMQLTEEQQADMRTTDADNVFNALDRGLMNDTLAWKELKEREVFLNSPDTEGDDMLNKLSPGQAEALLNGDINTTGTGANA